MQGNIKGSVKDMICPRCKNEISDDAKFCTKCGEKIEKNQMDWENTNFELHNNKEKLECPYCHTKLVKDAKFCVNCGHSINKDEYECEQTKKNTPRNKFVIGGIAGCIMGVCLMMIYVYGKSQNDLSHFEEAFTEHEFNSISESILSEQFETADDSVIKETEILTETVRDRKAVTMDDVENVYATSYLIEEKLGFIHEPSNVLDRNNATAWVENAVGQGEGESITLELDDLYVVSGFVINAGYQKNENVYENNSRPKELIVTFSDGNSQTVELEDYYGPQKIILDIPIETTKVTFTISSVYYGDKYEDTAISEISLF